MSFGSVPIGAGDCAAVVLLLDRFHVDALSACEVDFLQAIAARIKTQVRPRWSPRQYDAFQVIWRRVML